MSAFFGVQRPPDATFTVSASGPGNTGQSIVSASTANLIDGRPDSTVRFQWQTGASQTTSSVLNINVNWTATSFSPRMVGLSNISLPVATKVSLAFRRVADTLGTYPYTPTMYNNAQRIVAGPRGEQMVWIMLPAGASACLGVQIQIANDVNGSVGNSAGLGLFNIGDVVVCGGYDWDVEPGWTQVDIDPTMREYSVQRQPYASAVGCVYRQLDFAFKTDEQKTVFRDAGAPSNIYLRKLLGMLDRNQSAVYVMRYVDGSGTFDATQLHEIAFIGVATQLPKIQQKGALYYAAGGATVIEAPIPT